MTYKIFASVPPSSPVLPDPVVPADNESWDDPELLMSIRMSNDQMLDGLARRFPNQPSGPMTQQLNLAPQGSIVKAKYVYGYKASPAFTSDKVDMDRYHAESGIVSQSETYCLYSPDELPSINREYNNYPTANSYSRSEMLGHDLAKTYCSRELRLIKPGQTVLDIGADCGFFIKALKRMGIQNVIGIDPQAASARDYVIGKHHELNKKMSSATQDMLHSVLEMTLHDFMQDPDLTKVDVAVINNFNPSHEGVEEMLNEQKEVINPDTGCAIIGICGCDPHLASPSSPQYLGHRLASKYEHFYFVEAEDTAIGREKGSVGGQLGFFVCRKPIYPLPELTMEDLLDMSQFDDD